jgi:dipeptidyl aminopeptidase/acylaminoacyl peptidase
MHLTSSASLAQELAAQRARDAIRCAKTHMAGLESPGDCPVSIDADVDKAVGIVVRPQVDSFLLFVPQKGLDKTDFQGRAVRKGHGVPVGYIVSMWLPVLDGKIIAWHRVQHTVVQYPKAGKVYFNCLALSTSRKEDGSYLLHAFGTGEKPMFSAPLKLEKEHKGKPSVEIKSIDVKALRFTAEISFEGRRASIVFGSLTHPGGSADARSHPEAAFRTIALVSLARPLPIAPACEPDNGLAALRETPASPLSAALSPDGRWFTGTIRLRSGASRLMVRDTGGRSCREVADAQEPIFARDSKSLSYATVSSPGLEYIVRDLESWKKKRCFRFPSRVTCTADARHLVLVGPPGMVDAPANSQPPRADEVLVYSFIEDRVARFGPALFHELSSDGQLLALVKAGPNGHNMLDVLRVGETESRRVLDVRGEVTALAWGADQRSLALAVAQDQADGSTADLLVAVDDVMAKTPRISSILPERHATWPRGASLDPAALHVGDAGAIIYFVVLREIVASPRRPKDRGVEIHRAADDIEYDSLTDSLKEGTSRARIELFAWLVREDRIVKVTDEGRASRVVVGGQVPWAVMPGGQSLLVARKDVGSALFHTPPTEWDLVVPKSGARTPLGTSASPSLTGRYIAYFQGGCWWAFDTRNRARRRLTATTDPSFEAILAAGRRAGVPISGVQWLEDDHGLIAFDDHDAWLLYPDGRVRRRLTRGRERGRVYRLATLDGGHGNTHYFHVVETRTQHSGYVRVDENGGEEPIVFGPWAFDKFARAPVAEEFVFQRESYDSPPNFYVASLPGGETRAMTELTVIQETVPQPRRELIQFTERHGTELQGILIYPVGYNPSKKYPMVVSIYSICSDRYFRFGRSFTWYDDPLTFAMRGYFVLLPDIVYQAREVGPSAVDCVESGVRAVLRRSLADSARIGLVGTSHGGYETAFILSKSNMFAAGVAESPAVDFASYGLRGRLGNVQSQMDWLRSVGMTVPYWEDAESYIANSLCYQAHGITAALLIGVGRRDAVVDSRDGESLFNLLRYLKRPAYLLAYPAGGHGLGEDFKCRARQFLDHYLKGEPPPAWMAGTQR